MRLGKVLADYRFANRMGVRGLAKEIGLSQATLNRIENGGGCDGTSLIKIWQWLHGDGVSDQRRQKPETQ